MILEAKSVSYFSPLDERAFFEWLDRIPAVQKYEGEGLSLWLHVDDEMSESDLGNILGLFIRYKVDLSQLAVFRNAENERWFADPRKIWFKKVFGKAAR